MLPDNYACNPRNPLAGRMEIEGRDYFPSDLEIDYRGDDITVETILNLIRGRYPRGTPSSKRLDSTSESKVLIYMNGHGGHNFFKIQDTGVLQSEDLAGAFEEMKAKRRYKEVLFIIDTCAAFSLFDAIESEGLVLIGSSDYGQDAYSYKESSALNVLLSDHFSYFFHSFLRKERANLQHRSLGDVL